MSVGSRLTGRLAGVRRPSTEPAAAPFVERRRAQPSAGSSNYTPARVPYGVDLAAAWAWRLLVLVAGLYVVARGLGMFAVVVLPLVIALFLSALVAPIVALLARVLPRGVSALLVVVGSIALVALLLTFAGQQIAQGASDLSKQVVTGLNQVEDLLRDGPLHVTDSQINGYIKSAQDAVTSSNAQIVRRLTEVGTALGHIVAGLFIVLFATYFFLADGGRIWSWVVRLFPRAAQDRADSSGRVAWTSLTAFVRATVIVAFTDAVGIMIGAIVFHVPFVLAIGVLVFVGAFVPVVGAFLSGLVAVLVALVAQGPLVALLMLAVVVGVQQLEAHVLQPFLLGRLVSVHPLGVIVALAAGVIVGGIAGALVAVPFVAAANAVVLHLADTARVEADARDSPLGDSPGDPVGG